MISKHKNILHFISTLHFQDSGEFKMMCRIGSLADIFDNNKT